MSCEFSEYREGTRSYGDNIPGYAQGAYFPGDEPGTYCQKSGERCYLECGDDSPELCEVQEQSEIWCGDCDVPMMKNGNGVIYCPECGEVMNG